MVKQKKDQTDHSMFLSVGIQEEEKVLDSNRVLEDLLSETVSKVKNYLSLRDYKNFRVSINELEEQTFLYSQTMERKILQAIICGRETKPLAVLGMTIRGR